MLLMRVRTKVSCMHVATEQSATAANVVFMPPMHLAGNVSACWHS
jgi:hypothetical protein